MTGWQALWVVGYVAGMLWWVVVLSFFRKSVDPIKQAVWHYSETIGLMGLMVWPMMAVAYWAMAASEPK